jgi:hypothetical protein
MREMKESEKVGEQGEEGGCGEEVEGEGRGRGGRDYGELEVK